jgi:hypothetical protein
MGNDPQIMFNCEETRVNRTHSETQPHAEASGEVGIRRDGGLC